MIGIGTLESGRRFCERLPFPADSLYLDAERAVFAQLGLYKGIDRTFFNAATPRALKARGMEGLKEAAKGYFFAAPPNGDASATLQQGGVFVLDGEALRYGWRDEGTADHAPMADVLAACGVAA